MGYGRYYVILTEKNEAQELLWYNGWSIRKFKFRVAREFALGEQTKFYFADREGRRLFYFRPGTIYIEIERSRKRPACKEEQEELEEKHSAAKKRKRNHVEEVSSDYEETTRYYDMDMKKEDSREILVVGRKRSRSDSDEAPRRVIEPEDAPKRVSAFRRLGNDAKVKHAVQRWLGDGRAVQKKMKGAQKEATKDKSLGLCKAFLGLLEILAAFE